MNRFVFFLMLLFPAACGPASRQETTEKDPAAYADPMIGTGFHGHTFPGAVWPYGMVQVSPDTRLNEWDNCSGYHYDNPTIIGFSHTHYSGTGAPGGSDILFMPDTGRPKLSPGPEDAPRRGYRSAFSHNNEQAEPGYYKVLLDDNGITVELTATPRCAFHRYTFPAGSDGYVILDLNHGNADYPDSLQLNIDENTGEITGYRAAAGGLDGPRIWYFAGRFYPVPQKAISIRKEIPRTRKKKVEGLFRFDTRKNRTVLLKIALSPVSINGARKNLAAEIPGRDFDTIRAQARAAWNKELGRITIAGATEKQKRIFYTAMYHAAIHPSLFTDVDDRYRSSNGRVYRADGFVNYTTFSLWDTWRALHPLHTLIDRRRTVDFIRTFLERYEHAGNMPIMEFSGNERYSMIGYHSLPVVADAWAKGIRDFDANKARRVMRHLADSPRDGKKFYLQYGFIPYDLASQSVSRTLEYSYDDWCVTRLYDDAGDTAVRRYLQRGMFYRNLFNKKEKFMVPRSSHYRWKKDFLPGATGMDYTEANAWQYTPSVFQDIYGLVDLMGGDTAMERWLDRLFTTPVDTSVMTVIDVSGLIGQYAHGNEPSHHIAYLYDYVGAPWKTQQRVRQILTTLYDDTPAGICGNDDAGQMSAWYVLSALGFYPVTPGLDYFVIGSPLFPEAIIRLENGKTFTIRSENNAPENPYIQQVTLNGKTYRKTWLRYTDILQGGEMVFTMGPSPNKQWGSTPGDHPPMPRYEVAPLPEIHCDNAVFLTQTTVTLSCSSPEAVIRYTLDGKDPDNSSPRYDGPLTLRRTTTLKARCFVPGLPPGYAVSRSFRRITLRPAATVHNPRPGLRYAYREGVCETTGDMDKYPVLKRGTISGFRIDTVRDERPFAMRFTGYVRAPADGIYTFLLESNDGAVLYIDGEMVIDNDGAHGALTKQGKTGLKKGFHTLRVDYFQIGRAKKLTVRWKVPGKEKAEKIPGKALYH